MSKAFAEHSYDGQQKPRGVVLIVDDDPDVCAVMVASLAQKGFRVECVQSAEEALQRLTKGRIDLALIDLLLPGGPGLEIARRFADNGASVIVMSGALDAEERLAGSGFKLLAKPFRLKTLVAIVRDSVCGTSGLRPPAASSQPQPEAAVSS